MLLQMGFDLDYNPFIALQKDLFAHEFCWEMLKVAKAREEVARLNGIRVTCS